MLSGLLKVQQWISRPLWGEPPSPYPWSHVIDYTITHSFLRFWSVGVYLAIIKVFSQMRVEFLFKLGGWDELKIQIRRVKWNTLTFFLYIGSSNIWYDTKQARTGKTYRWNSEVFNLVPDVLWRDSGRFKDLSVIWKIILSLY